MAATPNLLRRPLTALVAQNTSYANLESTVTTTTGSGGQSMVGSTATILAGTASAPTTISMAWRTATTNEGLVSDVVDLSGIGVVGGQPKNGSVHTDTFVLQMNYSPLLLEEGTGLSEMSAALQGLITMDYLDTADDQWINAVDDNFGGTPNFVGDQPYNSSYFVAGRLRRECPDAYRVGGLGPQQRVRRGAGAVHAGPAGRGGYRAGRLGVAAAWGKGLTTANAVDANKKDLG